MTTFKAIDGTWSFGSTSYLDVMWALDEHPDGHIEVIQDGKCTMCIPFEDRDCYRQCSVCGELMQDGYYVEAFEYYCSDECLHKKYTQEEYLNMYEEDMAFWTEWY